MMLAMESRFGDGDDGRETISTFGGTGTGTR